MSLGVRVINAACWPMQGLCVFACKQNGERLEEDLNPSRLPVILVAVANGYAVEHVNLTLTALVAIKCSLSRLNIIAQQVRGGKQQKPLLTHITNLPLVFYRNWRLLALSPACLLPRQLAAVCLCVMLLYWNAADDDG